MSALAILSELHGQCFRMLALHVGDTDGLTVAARKAKKSRLVSSGLAKRLERLDVATHYARHATQAKAATFFARFLAELQATPADLPPVGPAHDPWSVGPDPWQSTGHYYPVAPLEAATDEKTLETKPVLPWHGGAASSGGDAHVGQVDELLAALDATHGVRPRAFKPPVVEVGEQTLRASAQVFVPFAAAAPAAQADSQPAHAGQGRSPFRERFTPFLRTEAESDTEEESVLAHLRRAQAQAGADAGPVLALPDPGMADSGIKRRKRRKARGGGEPSPAPDPPQPVCVVCGVRPPQPPGNACFACNFRLSGGFKGRARR